ncbi:MAG: hypothetical protein HOP07_12065 [Bacteriovoracaceae bacterium]|nr:hypothetical protein [Bacteriovoracaceae bacterium]
MVDVKFMANKLIISLFLCLAFVSCGQDYNSNYGDKGRYTPIEGIDSSTPAGARMLGVYRVMQDKCFQCHQWSNYKTAEQWEAAGIVSRGSLSGSICHTRLKNNGSDMPPDPIAQLTAEELTAVEEWILNM